MKSLATKLIALIFVVMLSVGCASSITAPQDLQKDEQVKKENQVKPGDITTGHDMEESVERPSQY